MNELERDQLEAARLEAPKDVSNETALNTIRLFFFSRKLQLAVQSLVMDIARTLTMM